VALIEISTAAAECERASAKRRTHTSFSSQALEKYSLAQEGGLLMCKQVKAACSTSFGERERCSQMFAYAHLHRSKIISVKKSPIKCKININLFSYAKNVC